VEVKRRQALDIPAPVVGGSVESRGTEVGVFGTNVVALSGALHLDDGVIILAGRGAVHIDVMNVRDGQLSRVLSAECGILDIVALIDQDWVVDIHDLEVLECNILDVAKSTAHDAIGVWIVGEDFDASAVLSVGHDDIVDPNVGYKVGLILVLAKRSH